MKLKKLQKSDGPKSYSADLLVRTGLIQPCGRKPLTAVYFLNGLGFKFKYLPNKC